MAKNNTLRYLIPIILCTLAIIGLLVCNEWVSYQQCKVYQSYNREVSFLTKYPNSKYSADVRKCLKKHEKQYVDENLNGLKAPSYISDYLIEKYQSAYEKYNAFFPDGELRPQAYRFILDIREESDYRKLIESYDVSDEEYQAYLEKYPNTSHLKEIEYKRATAAYKNYSLKNGSQPYSKYYGYNSTSGGSSIVINSSSNHDCVVTVKYNNSDGKVAGHVYVHRGESAEINLPSGRTYQVFFYSGTGWYPDKEMPKGVKGGFLQNESFSCDDKPYTLSYGEYMTYTLTPVTNGNFTPKTTNQNNFF